MATSVQSTRNLVGVQSIAFIRAIALTLRLTGARPNTPMNVFFDGVLVNQFCNPRSGTLVPPNTTNLGQPVITNANGEISLVLNIPGGRFNTGERLIVITDSPTLASLELPGATFGSARATFTTNGVTQIFQETSTVTTNTTVVLERVLPPPEPARIVFRGGGGGGGRDPLAQSFFTYGITGGCYLTSIDLFFNTKDPIIPVRIDIRPMVNGLPHSVEPTDDRYICFLTPDRVSISNNASVPTNFKFDVPVYLEEDKDYCFVVFSNSKQYNLFSSKLGERSFETGRTIFEQPFSGSLFRSENNITWQPEQFEDIKFNLNIAKFDTSINGVVKLKAVSDFFGVSGEYVTTTQNSPIIRVKQTVQHGLEVNSKVFISADAGAVYNGIFASNIAGLRNVISVSDEYTFSFSAGANASTTGPILTGRQVREIQIDKSGSGYTSAPTISITGGGGTGATAVAIVAGGNIVRVDVINKGLNYTSAPTVSVTGGGGTGAVLTAIIEAGFLINVNKPTNFIISNIPAYATQGAELSAKVTTTQLNYIGGNLNTYSPAEILDMNIQGRTYLNTNSVIASSYNEIDRIGSNPSILLDYSLSSKNQNVSPLIDISNAPSLISYNYRIRSQENEDIDATTSTGTLSQVNILNFGSGYTSPPIISFVGDSDVSASAVALLGTTAISSVNVLSSGSGYTSPPTVTIAGGGGTGATASAILSGATIASVSVTAGGSGYTAIPSIVLSGGGGGTGAVLTAALSSVGISSITINSGGTGYTSTPTVSITGGGGTGATATATLAPASVSSISLTSGGSGYTSVPSVTLSGGGGTGAIAAATLTTAVVESISVTTGGTGYTSTPTVSITGGGGTGATADAVVVSGIVTSITITNTGSGYTSTPTVSITGGGGTGATGSAVLSTRIVESISVTTGGTGYTSTPTVSITGGGGTGADATAVLSTRIVAFISIISAGTGYTSAPTVSITGGGGTGADATAVLDTRSVSSISVTNPGSGYTTPPNLIFSGGGGTGAAGSAVLSSRGVSSISLISGGSGYTSAPSVTISGGGGTGATANATISGRSISTILITDPGTNYSSPPEVVITRVDGSSGVDAIATSILTTFNSELSPDKGTALSRYVTKKFTLETPSTGINLFSEIYSEQQCGVDWYIRTSKSGTTDNHDDLEWKILSCDIDRNRSTKRGEAFDYKFYLYNLIEFDVYDLKCVLRSSNPAKAPEVNNYRAIIVA